MQIQIHIYILKLLTLFLLLFIHIFFLLILVCSFFICLFRLKNWKISGVAFISIHVFTFISIHVKYFYRKMSLKSPKTLRKCEENLQPQMPELQFLRALIFSRTLWKLQNWVNFSVFSYLKFFHFEILVRTISVKPD